MKVLIALNTTWNLVNFRAGLIRALLAAGHEVTAVAPPDGFVPQLLALGCRYVPLPMDNKGTHPGRDSLLYLRFLRLMRQERPDAFLGYTVKPNIYGSLAAHLLGIPVINNIAGLGAVFISKSWLTTLVKVLYRLALSRSSNVFFQNRDDAALFLSAGLVRPEIVGFVPGSGVDIERFAPQENSGGKGAGMRFLLIARMLWDKGVGEYVAAARQIRRIHPDAEFSLLGFLDVQNPAAIARNQMDAWVAEGAIRYLGETDDPRPFIAAADCIVLPSYREGTPRTLLEAAAMAKPIVTTDAVGCREVVEDGRTGFLCQPRNAEDLAAALLRFMALPAEVRHEMGRQGRDKIVRQFDERIVIGKYLDAITGICRDSTHE